MRCRFTSNQQQLRCAQSYMGEHARGAAERCTALAAVLGTVIPWQEVRARPQAQESGACRRGGARAGRLPIDGPRRPARPPLAAGASRARASRAAQSTRSGLNLTPNREARSTWPCLNLTLSAQRGAHGRADAGRRHHLGRQRRGAVRAGRARGAGLGQAALAQAAAGPARHAGRLRPLPHALRHRHLAGAPPYPTCRGPRPPSQGAAAAGRAGAPGRASGRRSAWRRSAASRRSSGHGQGAGACARAGGKQRRSCSGALRASAAPRARRRCTRGGATRPGSWAWATARRGARLPRSTRCGPCPCAALPQAWQSGPAGRLATRTSTRCAEGRPACRRALDVSH